MSIDKVMELTWVDGIPWWICHRRRCGANFTSKDISKALNAHSMKPLFRTWPPTGCWTRACNQSKKSFLLQRRGDVVSEGGRQRYPMRSARGTKKAATGATVMSPSEDCKACTTGYADRRACIGCPFRRRKTSKRGMRRSWRGRYGLKRCWNPLGPSRRGYGDASGFVTAILWWKETKIILWSLAWTGHLNKSWAKVGQGPKGSNMDWRWRN